jgi:hypothetical protein
MKLRLAQRWPTAVAHKRVLFCGARPSRGGARPRDGFRVRLRFAPAPWMTGATAARERVVALRLFGRVDRTRADVRVYFRAIGYRDRPADNTDIAVLKSPSTGCFRLIVAVAALLEECPKRRWARRWLESPPTCCISSLPHLHRKRALEASTLSELKSLHRRALEMQS